MMRGVSMIWNDDRTISGIYYDDPEESRYSLSSGHHIKAYPEPGPHGDIAYFAVYNASGIIEARVPAWKVTVVYEL